MAVSIRDVAEAAGVSPTTVSHVLSGRRPVAAETARNVRETMARLGYSPMSSARNLALGRTHLIGVLVPDISNAFFAELAKGIESQAVAGGYHIVLANTGYGRETSLEHLELIRSRAVDGVLYAAGSAFTQRDILDVIGELPLVLVDELVKGSSVPLVTSDNEAGGRMAAHYLYGLGHRNVMVLRGPAELGTSEARVGGFQEAWQALDSTTLVLVDSDFTIAGGARAVHGLADNLREQGITAIFATNDEMAIGAMRQLQDEGIRIPEEMSVMGFDDVPSSALVAPRLTTMRQNVSAMGEIACQRLINSLSAADRHHEGPILLPVTLVERESCAEVAADSKELEENK